MTRYCANVPTALPVRGAVTMLCPFRIAFALQLPCMAHPWGMRFLSGRFLLGLDLLDECDMLLGGQPSLVHDLDLPDPSSHEQYDGAEHETEIDNAPYDSAVPAEVRITERRVGHAEGTHDAHEQSRQERDKQTVDESTKQQLEDERDAEETRRR